MPHYAVSGISVVLVCLCNGRHSCGPVCDLCSGLALRLFLCSSCFSLNIPETFPLCALKSSLSRQLLMIHLRIKLTLQVSPSFSLPGLLCSSEFMVLPVLPFPHSSPFPVCFSVCFFLLQASQLKPGQEGCLSVQVPPHIPVS